MKNTLESEVQPPKSNCCGGKCAAAAKASSSGVNAATRFADMVRVSGGDFVMGSDNFYREERPSRRDSVKSFWIDLHPVTNAQFQAFVADTAYITTSERPPDPALYPDADPALLCPGSLVFTKSATRVSVRDNYQKWWAYVPGASWKSPLGPDSSLAGLAEHPVVHISFEDARAYSNWACKALPTEAEWEFAARGGLDSAAYAWGDEFMPEGRPMANTWQGEFPWQNTMEDGYERTSPVKTYPANGYGLYDMIGNVWEWTASRYDGAQVLENVKSCCLPEGLGDPDIRHAVKGGSHLCAPNYCLRYRPAARQGQTLDTATGHIGFRCVIRE